MPGSWKDAKDCALREGRLLVFHDCDDDVYGACSEGEVQGVFRNGVFIEHRCICMPASLSAEELTAKEKRFREGNPDW